MIKKCVVCGKEYYVKPSHAKNRKTCSRKCGGIRHSQQLKKRIVKICPICGKEFEVSPSSKQKYCSYKCAGIARTKHLTVMKTCEYCGKKYKLSKSRAKYSRFCNIKCRNKWQSEKMTGKGNITYGTHLQKKTRNKISKANKIYTKEQILEHQRNYYKKNRERIRKYMKEYNKDNEQLHAWRRNYMKNKRQTDLKYILNARMSRLISYSLKGDKKGRHWEDLVGYTKDTLIKHLQQTIPKGYTWQDFLKGNLHVDHIIPISVFNFTKPEHADFKRCWALKNLQLLPAEENIKKSNKLYKPFQPALKIKIS